MSSIHSAIVVALSLAAAVGAASIGQTPGDTYTATATVSTGSARAMADVTVKIDRYAQEEERAALISAMRQGGAAAAQQLLSARPDSGFLKVGERRAPIKYAWKHPAADGQLVTVATAEALVFLGAGLPQAKPVTGFDVAIAILKIGDGAASVGELAPAAKLAIDDNGALRIEDYSANVIWLKGLVRARD